MLDHQRSYRHRTAVASQVYAQSAPVSSASTSTSGPSSIALKCTICAISFDTSEAFNFHVQTWPHIKKQRVARFLEDEQERSSSKHAVELPPQSSFDLKSIPFSATGSGTQRFMMNVDLRNDNTSTLTVYAPQITNLTRSCILVSVSSSKNFPLTVKPQSISTVSLYYEPLAIGFANIKISFSFSIPGAERFVIGRTFKGFIGDKALFDSLRPTTPYQRKATNTRSIIGSRSIVHAPRLEGGDAKNYMQIPLPEFGIPDAVKKCLTKSIASRDRSLADEFEALFLPKDFKATGAHHILNQQLLWAEEVQMGIDIKNYSLTGVTLTRTQGGQFMLQVDGLAENRPSIIRGDSVFVRESASTASRVYEGRASRIELVNVILVFDHSFDNMFTDGMKFDVEFTFNRVSLRRMHQATLNDSGLLSNFDKEYAAIDIDEWAERADKSLKTIDLLNLKPFNRLILSNPQQLRAVALISAAVHVPFPFLLFGPPGTGKTVTIIESIKQIFWLQPSAKFLICAPSNSAADLLLERLSDTISKREMFRLNAVFRTQPSSFVHMADYSLPSQSGMQLWDVPSLESIVRYRVIVTTCCSAAMLHGMGIPDDHFTHVFVDESGQGLEPEVMIPLNTFAFGKNTRFVLAGDHKQLGPIIHSMVAKAHGLGISLLERLMGYISPESIAYSKKLKEKHHPRLRIMPDKAELYKKAVSVMFIKLIKNFRSHPDILRVPSNLFYDGELEPCADPVMCNQYLQWPVLPNAESPLLFQHVDGKDEREGNSPSWFNSTECLVVLDMVKKLRDNRHGSRPIVGSDIGIITPYNRQVQKIRKLLEGQGYGNTSVGSVETFQGAARLMPEGQERKVIIISTVRSNPDHLSHDAKFNLGFLSDPKRFNVAVTRAKALLIVIGNANILMKDESWRAWIQQAHQLGATKNLPEEIKSDLSKEVPASLFAASKSGGTKIVRRGANEESDEDDSDHDGYHMVVEQGWRIIE
eukprot:jgi/Hompol1/1567/HPOL_002715-RA